MNRTAKAKSVPQTASPSVSPSQRTGIPELNLSWCRVVSSDRESLKTSPHRHMLFELHYVYEGMVRFNADTDYTIDAGNCILLPSGITHTISDFAANTMKLVAGFYFTDIPKGFEDIISRMMNTVLVWQVPFAFQHTAEFLKDKLDLHNTLTPAYTHTLFTLLLLQIFDYVSDSIPDQPLRLTDRNPRQEQILSFIKEKIFENITPQDVADYMGVSLRHAARIAEALFGCSFSALIRTIRLQRICELLVSSSYSITDIAEIAGFSSPYSFIRHFRNYTGVTPAAYRKNYEIKR